jgi:hypothetical protein
VPTACFLNHAATCCASACCADACCADKCHAVTCHAAACCGMLCCAVAHRQGIIFLILNYNHIKSTLRAADSSALQRMSSSALQRMSSSGIPTAAAAAGRQQQQQQLQPESPAGRLGLGSSGAAAIKECEVCQGAILHCPVWVHVLTKSPPLPLPCCTHLFVAPSPQLTPPQLHSAFLHPPTLVPIPPTQLYVRTPFPP